MDKSCWAIRGLLQRMICGYKDYDYQVRMPSRIQKNDLQQQQLLPATLVLVRKEPGRRPGKKKEREREKNMNYANATSARSSPACVYIYGVCTYIYGKIQINHHPLTSHTRCCAAVMALCWGRAHLSACSRTVLVPSPPHVYVMYASILASLPLLPSFSPPPAYPYTGPQC